MEHHNHIRFKEKNKKKLDFLMKLFLNKIVKLI